MTYSDTHGRGAHGASQEALIRMWSALDTTGSGVLGWDSIYELLARLGREPHAMDFTAVMCEMDPRRTGAVSFSNFKLWIEHQHELAERQLALLDGVSLDLQS